MECFEWWVVWKDLENLGEIFYFNVIAVASVIIDFFPTTRTS